MKKEIIAILTISAFLIGICIGQTGGSVTLEGKQFKINGNNFYPLIMNYNVGRTSSVVSGNLVFYASPATSYGSTGDYECNDLNTCNAEFLNHFTKIRTMGFNTIRIDLSATYCSNIPISSSSRFYSIIYDQNMGPGNQYNTTYSLYALDMASNFTDQNSVNHFSMIINLLDLAESAGLKVILVCGQSYKNLQPPHERVMWQTYDDLAASHFASYLEKLATVAGAHPALMAFDFINEPIYQEMYKDYSNAPLTKETVCSYVSMWYDAIRANSNKLVTLGSSTIDELFYFDPGVMKLDFYSPHIYTKGHPMYPDFNVAGDHGLQNGFERYAIINYWMDKAYPMPWIIGETGFSADDNLVNPGLFPNHLDNNPVHHNPPWMFGSESQQLDFAQYSLDITRNAGASGYSWWAFQNVFWFNLMSSPSEYTENFWGLLHYGDQTTNTWYEKPAVSVFQSYLNAQGQPPAAISLAKPANYYDPYEIASKCAPCLPNAVSGKIVDEKGNDVENAVVLGSSWNETIDPDGSMQQLGYYNGDETFVMDISFTFTEPDGDFTVIPYNYKQPAIGDHRLVSMEVTSIGGDRKRIGPEWPYGDQQMVNPGIVTLKGIITGYDAIVSNEMVAAGEVRNYYGHNTLTISNLELDGESNLTARKEININSEFNAHASITTSNNNETHIYISDAFSDCELDFGGYFRTFSRGLQNNGSEILSSKEIEVKFNLAKTFLVNVSPNPSSGIFNVTIQNPLSNSVQVLLTNLLGEVILTKNIAQTELLFNFDFLPKGIYFMRFNNNENWLTKKIIIK